MIKSTIAVVGLVIAGGLLFFYTQPTYDNVQQLKTQISGFNQALDKAQELQKLKQTLLSRYNSFNPGDIERLQKLLPDHVDNVRLVLDLDSLAGQHGLALQNVVISNGASSGQDTGVIGSIGASRTQFDSLTLKFSTVGTYSNFLSFLEDLESSLRIVDLTSLTLNSEGTAGPEPTYRYNLSVRTYWLK